MSSDRTGKSLTLNATASRQPRTKTRNAKIGRGLKIKGWELVEELGAGGNGVVWRASKTGRSDCAIKILRNLNPETFQRFRAEVEALSEAEGIDGVIPMLDFEIPDDEKIELRWLRMPLAEPFNPEPQTQKMSETVQRFLDLAVTLQQLHLRQMYHRDIKPQNILVYKGRLCFADFGLVKFEKRRSGITPSRRDVGPKFVMAPEMRRTARTAAGGPADVYSFMKTLWIALTNERLGFDGQYVTGSSLSLKNYLPGSYTTTIDELLVECTDNDPEARPRIDHVIGQLRQWLVLTEDFHRRNLREWTEVEGKLFPASVPSRASWTNIDDVCAVLRLVADINSLNHMFMPTGGGMTVTHVRKSEVEAGFLVLEHGYLTVMKPKRLSYESFGPGSEWNYFRLEAAITSPSKVPGTLRNPDGYSEELCEVARTKYIGGDRWYDESKPLPENGKLVARYLKGAFVLFSTRSSYNLDPGTYDARHEIMTGRQFRSYIKKNKSRLNSADLPKRLRSTIMLG